MNPSGFGIPKCPSLSVCRVSTAQCPRDSRFSACEDKKVFLRVAMSLLITPSNACQSPSACMIARLSGYAYFLETVVGWQVRDVQ